MLVHSFMAGAAIFGILSLFLENGTNWLPFLKYVMLVGVAVNLFTMLMELTMTHPTNDAKRTVDMIVRGRYKNKFWMGVLLLGNIIPMLILFFGGGSATMLAIAGVTVLIGIWFTEDIWVEAPQRIPLS